VIVVFWYFYIVFNIVGGILINRLLVGEGGAVFFEGGGFFDGFVGFVSYLGFEVFPEWLYLLEYLCLSAEGLAVGF